MSISNGFGELASKIEAMKNSPANPKININLLLLAIFKISVSFFFLQQKPTILMKMGIHHSVTRSFKYAGEGIKTALKNEPNFRIHIFFAVIAIILATVLGFNYIEWILLFIVIFFVIMLELINTVLESLVDLVSPDIKGDAKVAKDVSAAAVLFAAFISVVVGIILFLPKIISKFS